MSQIVVIGLGRFGFNVARRLHEAGHEVLAVDVDPQIVQKVQDVSTRAVVLDARDSDRLAALGVADFDVAVVSLGELVDVSTLVALHLKELGVPKIVTKAGSDDHAKLLRLIGVHEIVHPEREAAEQLAQRLTHANLLEHLPLGDSHSIEEIAPSERFIGRTLRELELPRRFGVQVLGVHDVLADRIDLNPGADFRVKDSDALIVLGRNEDMQKLKDG
jgi:trk system potassium uptake protein TrkA